jgi:hypothetical protein
MLVLLSLRRLPCPLLLFLLLSAGDWAPHCLCCCTQAYCCLLLCGQLLWCPVVLWALLLLLLMLLLGRFLPVLLSFLQLPCPVLRLRLLSARYWALCCRCCCAQAESCWLLLCGQLLLSSLLLCLLLLLLHLSLAPWEVHMLYGLLPWPCWE